VTSIRRLDRDASPNALMKLRQDRDEMYQEARANPGSEADETVRMVLLADVSGMEAIHTDCGLDK
jgi:hypothetical protein